MKIYFFQLSIGILPITRYLSLLFSFISKIVCDTHLYNIYFTKLIYTTVINDYYPRVLIYAIHFWYTVYSVLIIFHIFAIMIIKNLILLITLFILLGTYYNRELYSNSLYEASLIFLHFLFSELCYLIWG